MLLLILHVLLPHQVVPVLNRCSNMIFWRPSEIELHYLIVLELGLADDRQLALSFGKDEEGGVVVAIGVF